MNIEWINLCSRFFIDFKDIQKQKNNQTFNELIFRTF